MTHLFNQLTGLHGVNSLNVLLIAKHLVSVTVTRFKVATAKQTLPHSCPGSTSIKPQSTPPLPPVMLPLPPVMPPFQSLPQSLARELLSNCRKLNILDVLVTVFWQPRLWINVKQPVSFHQQQINADGNLLHATLTDLAVSCYHYVKPSKMKTVLEYELIRFSATKNSEVVQACPACGTQAAVEVTKHTCVE